MAGIDDVKGFKDLLSQVTDGFKDFFSNLETTLEKLAGIPSILTGSDDSLKRVTNSANDTNKALDTTLIASKNIINSMADMASSSGKVFSAMLSGNRQNVDALGDVNSRVSTIISSLGLMALGSTDAFSALNDSAKTSISNLAGFNDIFSKTIGLVLQKLNFPLIGEISNFIPVATKAIDSTNNLETSLLALHAQAGDLTTTLTGTGSSQGNLTKLTDEYTSAIARTALQTGQSIPSVINYSKEVLKIPGLYSEIIKTPLNENLSFTEAAMKATAGTTQNFNDVLEISKTQMLNFANSGEKSLELLSRMYSVSNSLGTPFDLVQKQVKDVAEQFKFLGDNTQGALTIFNSLGEGLQKSKIGPAAMAEIVNDVTSSIGKLDIAQKSFLSAQTGGAGGLQGGYQIEEMLANGKIDEVYKKLEGTLRQEFGGKITTRKEAATNAGDASQYTKEVAFLTQGPFGAIVKSSEEAARLLEGFKTGLTTPKETPTENQLKDGLSKTLDAGTSLQQNQYTELQKISINTDIFKLYAQKDLGQKARSITNTELSSEANPTSLKESTKNAPSADKAIKYAGTDISASVKDTFGKIINSDQLDFKNKFSEKDRANANKQLYGLTPTDVENNVGKNTNNLAPNVQSPDINAQKNRQNILRERQDRPDTVEANVPGNQTIIIKTQQVGLDGKTKEELAATITASTIKKIQTYDQNSATVGHQGHQ
jgi:hypothetical protein